MATWNKNDLLSNTLYSIARQKTSFPFEVCIVDDCSDVDPEPIIRKFLPDAKYKKFTKRQGFDVVTTHALSLASNDADILIMQSSDVIHGSIDTIERLCQGVGKKQVCMAVVGNTDPPLDMYKDFENYLPLLNKQHQDGRKRSKPKKGQTSFYFFLGAIKRSDYESLKCVKGPYCDVILAEELIKSNFIANYPKELVGFHQAHSVSTVPCTKIDSCSIPCSARKRCLKQGWHTLDDYLKEYNQ